MRVQFYFERAHYLFIYLIDVYINFSSLSNILILLYVIFLTYVLSVTVLTW